MDMKLKVVVVPVSDVDRAKDFYTALGWRLDADIATDENFGQGSRSLKGNMG
ncbi:VOC family protein [Streptomyces sp. NPDC001530]|uniref:VOC family protein n=1 Tax=Streptomyces sp. NPDC001530 TaxID=3364582 RepID=UPI003674F28F